jgi:hypothetical protein
VGLASSFAVRPDMYVGSPVTFEHTLGFIEDVGLGARDRNRTRFTDQQVTQVVASSGELGGQDQGSRVRGDPDPVSGTEVALHGSCAHSAERPSAPPAGVARR